MLMIRPPPPWAIICLAASWVPKNALFQIHRHDLLELRLGGVQHGGPGLDPCVVDHHVEAAVRRVRRVDHPLQVLDLGDVGLDPDRLLAQPGDLTLELLLRLLVGDEVDDDVGPLPGEGQDHRLADAGVATGHDCDLAGQLLSHVEPTVLAPATALSPDGGRTLSSRSTAEKP